MISALTYTTIMVAGLVAHSNAMQVNTISRQQRAQVEWRNEVSNKFEWKATQELKWTVANFFTDVQTSPDGDVYAV